MKTITKKGAPINAKPTLTFSLSESKAKTGYPESKTETFLKGLELRAKALGQIPDSYDILSKYMGRKLVPFSSVKPSSLYDANSKGFSAEGPRVKKIIDSYLGGIRYELPPKIGATSAGEEFIGTLAGDHRYVSEEELKVDDTLIDLLNLNLSDPYDQVMGDLISTNTNNHPPQWAMTNKELIAFIYRVIIREGNESIVSMFNPSATAYKQGGKKACHNYIKMYKDPISSSSLKTILKGIHQKMNEGGAVGMFKNFKSEYEYIVSNDYLNITPSDNLFDVEVSMIHRNLFDKLAIAKGITGRPINIILTLTTSDFAISEESLNKTRYKRLFSLNSDSSAQSTVNKFKLWDEQYQDYLELVKIIGYRAQHSAESVSKLIRIDKNKNVTYVTYDEALKLPSMVT